MVVVDFGRTLHQNGERVGHAGFEVADSTTDCNSSTNRFGIRAADAALGGLKIVESHQNTAATKYRKDVRVRKRKSQETTYWSLTKR